MNLDPVLLAWFSPLILVAAYYAAVGIRLWWTAPVVAAIDRLAASLRRDDLPPAP